MLRRLVDALVAAIACLLSGCPGLSAMATTTASPWMSTYDVGAVARIDDHDFAVAEASPAQRIGLRAWSASPSAEARDTSTTSSLSMNATNTGDDALRALSTSEQRAVRSLQQQVADHTAKLEAYQVNPSAFDNLGILERAPTAEIRQSIIDGRVRHLSNEIQAFQDQIDKLLGGAG